ncbi:exodeoxyribonuclease V subunit beta [Lacinutrix sp. Hel_I_90]|uniref:UvrD-helicase domain-containing protein n=1 Tax=Lacinutrix sp. Hel_I_90 TaxID=1249999 RepID=UPI0005CB5108|nr:UvrD-helicase domain-containing protein [Lacinutrix sp. Hel_I_90]
MATPSPFQVYNASAGSGKTFTLVKEYLKILFSASTQYLFKHILAITFTNKAVAEMKARILEMLRVFSEVLILEQPNAMFIAIAEELKMEPKILHNKAITILNTIMHNYAAFDISTIDGFNHRLIRTFAHDLKLPLNFEVELDTKSLLTEAVDRVIAKAGIDKRLTKILIDFAIEKANDDKSWDVSRDFNAIAEILLKESDFEYIKLLDDKTLDDFEILKKQLITEKTTTEKLIVEEANALLSLLESNGLAFSDFSGAYLPKHFEKLANNNLSVSFDPKWQEDLGAKTLYPKRVSAATAATIENLQPQIATAFNETKAGIFHLKFLKTFAKNITPLSVLKAISQELSTIKIEENKMLISEFNAIISDEIKGQPTPFIYERMGEKFKHYFIDEFQDTSQMQWDNLIPLIGNTLSGENLKAEKGTALLVGDAKQAIYRWRGGKAEQFMKLFNLTEKPFHSEQHVKNLESNYRSLQTIVQFNNAFFKHVSTSVFSKAEYGDLYEKAFQQPFKQAKGYVNLNFIDFEKDEIKDEIYTQQVLQTIHSCQKNGYRLKDICILVRKKKQGIAIAEYLSSQNIKITSSETMLINRAPEVQLINNVLSLLIKPNDSERKVHVLDFIAEKHNIEDKHTFFKIHVHLDLESFFDGLKPFDIHLNPKTIVQEALFDIAETIVRGFKLVTHSNAYVQFYLDTVLDYSQNNSSDISSFLEYFETKKGALSIVSPQEQEAVQIMTIHKSKGLEFPVVIFPYAEVNLYEDIEPKEWLPINSKQYQGFTHTLLNFNKDFEFFGEAGNAIYKRHKAELELDSLNLLYVALTRPIEQLYVIGKKDLGSKSNPESKSYSSLLINYLMETGEWEDTKTVYCFGSEKRTEKIEDLSTIETIEQTTFISTAKAEHNIKIVANSGCLWDTNQEQAIEKGNLVHDLMEHIKTENDVDFAINDFLSSGIINEEQAKILRMSILEIIHHPDLNSYFSESNTIYNERDILSKTGKIYRPDRLVINNKKDVVIIDYKTGLPNPKYQHQLQDYQDILEDMNFKITKKILIYINEDIKVQTY